MVTNIIQHDTTLLDCWIMFKEFQNILSMSDEEVFWILVGLEISGNKQEDAIRLKNSREQVLLFVVRRSILKSPQTNVVTFFSVAHLYSITAQQTKIHR